MINKRVVSLTLYCFFLSKLLDTTSSPPCQRILRLEVRGKMDIFSHIEPQLSFSWSGELKTMRRGEWGDGGRKRVQHTLMLLFLSSCCCFWLLLFILLLCVVCVTSWLVEWEEKGMNEKRERWWELLVGLACFLFESFMKSFLRVFMRIVKVGTLCRVNSDFRDFEVERFIRRWRTRGFLTHQFFIYVFILFFCYILFLSTFIYTHIY